MAKGANTKFSVWAIAGFIVGLLSFAYWISVLGVILNIYALVQISKSGQRGKVLAIIGLVLSVIFLIAVSLGIFSFKL